MVKILLLISLLLLFYSLTVGQFPDITNLKKVIQRFVLPGGSAVFFFLAGTLLFQTPLAGLPWAILGWFIPGWITDAVYNHKQDRLRDLARDFVTSASGLFAAGQMTSEVVRTMADRLPEPLAAEFQDMIRTRNVSPHASFPRMFNDLSEKYNLSEFKAVSTILSASDQAGGPTAAAKGLKRLGHALRQRDRLIKERKKAIMESKIAAIVVVIILAVGLLLDATLFKHLFEGPGKFIMAFSSMLLVGLIFIITNVMRFKDLA